MKRVAFVAVAMLVAGCSWETGPSEPAPSTGSQTSNLSTGTHSGPQDARDAGHNPDPGAFGASCTSGSDCESHVCFSGGKGGFCSLSCTSDAQCPAGADGTQHCNPHGYCRY